MWTFVTENEVKTGALANVWGRSIGPGLWKEGGEGGAIWAFRGGNVAYQRDRGTLTPPLIHPHPDTGLVRDPLKCCCLFGASPTPALLPIFSHNQRQIGVTNPFSVESEQTWSQCIHSHSPTFGLNPLVTIQSSLPWIHFKRSPHFQRRPWLVEKRLVVEGKSQDLSGRASPALCLLSLVVSFSRCCGCPETGELPDAPPSLSSTAIAAALPSRKYIQGVFLLAPTIFSSEKLYLCCVSGTININEQSTTSQPFFYSHRCCLPSRKYIGGDFFTGIHYFQFRKIVSSVHLVFFWDDQHLGTKYNLPTVLLQSLVLCHPGNISKIKATYFQLNTPPPSFHFFHKFKILPKSSRNSLLNYKIETFRSEFSLEQKIKH